MADAPTAAPAAASTAAPPAVVPAGAITSDSMKPGAGQAAEKAAATTADGLVMVKPLAAYLCSATGEMRSAGGDAYAVDPSRAAELFARGLVDYDKPEDETKATEARVRSKGDAIRTRRGR